MQDNIKMDLKRGRMGWYELNWNRIGRNGGKFLTIHTTGRLSRRAQAHEVGYFITKTMLMSYMNFGLIY
jgi:hypothetical protein